jgi:crotonobetainyl-CoA:carnitine CoA-transferase CaiB-like acyl-CoA transferase
MRFATPDDRRVNADALVAEVSRELLRRPAAGGWGPRGHVPCAPVNTVADAVRTPQGAARNMVLEIADPVIGPLFVAGNPIKLSDMPDPKTHRPPPELDADRAAILAWLRARRPPA